MSKLTSGGNILWFRDIGGSGATAKGSGIAVDGSGNVYVSGSASGAKINFGPSVSLQPAGSQDGFVSEQDGNGDFGWVEDVGGAGAQDQVTGIAADPSGNVYVTGSFSGRAQFDQIGMSAQGIQDGFVAYLFTGKGHFFRWVNDIGGTNAVVGGTSLAVDGQDNLSVTGSFQHKIAFQGTTLTLSTAAGGSGTDGFVCGLSSNGTFLWADDFSGVRSTPRIAAVAVDAGGNVYVTGVFPGAINFGPYVLTGLGLGDAFVSKLDSGGNFQWARDIGGGTASAAGSGIAVDTAGNLYTTGSYSHTVDFDPGSGVFRLTGPATLSPSAFFLDRLTQTQVQGTAVNAQAQPVAGVVVRLFGSFNSTIGDPDDALLVTTVTDSQGHYQLLGPADFAHYYVVFGAPTGLAFASLASGSSADSQARPGCSP